VPVIFNGELVGGVRSVVRGSSGRAIVVFVQLEGTHELAKLRIGLVLQLQRSLLCFGIHL